MTAVSAPDVAIDPKRRKRLLAASLLSSSIEWYDFFIFGTQQRWCSLMCSFPTAPP